MDGDSRSENIVSDVDPCHRYPGPRLKKILTAKIAKKSRKVR